MTNLPHAKENKMKEIVIATRNRHKFDEIVQILSGIEETTFLFAGDFPALPEIDETGDTLLENAIIKAKATAELLQRPCIADDTGFFVEALNGEPGIYAARYAGENCSYSDNVDKLLKNMKDKTNRTAYFLTVSVLYCPIKGLIAASEGKVTGKLTTERQGISGFGYDPIFIPNDQLQNKTYAQMDDTEKNNISHRYLSIKGLLNDIPHSPLHS